MTNRIRSSWRIAISVLVMGVLGLGSLMAGESAAVTRLKSQNPGVRVEQDAQRTWVASSVRSITPALALGGNSRGVVRSFLKEHQDLFGHGAEILDRSRLIRDDAGTSGLHTLVWQEELQGIPVEGAMLVAHIGKDGALLSISDSTPRIALPKGTVIPGINAETALERAVASTGGLAAQVVVTTAARAQDLTQKQSLQARGVKGAAHTRLRWKVQNQAPVLSWQVIVTSESDDLMRSVFVDAASGLVLSSQVLTVQERWSAGEKSSTARTVSAEKQQSGGFSAGGPLPLSATALQLRCYGWPNESPRPMFPGSTTVNPPLPATVSRLLVDPSSLMVLGSPLGWVEQDRTKGNNVFAYLDANDDDVPDALTVQGSGNPLTFDFPMSLAQEPDVNDDAKRAAVVNLFYWCNYCHDKLYELGFTESAGNFQTVNFGQGGEEGDVLEAQAQDGSIPHAHPPSTATIAHYNNANMGTPPDGFSPRMQMYLWDETTPKLDGDYDATVVIHEYVHGLSTRLVGGGNSNLWTLQAGGMGEGWSDFYPCALLSQESDVLDGNYIVGAYLTGDYNKGIRHYPYTTDMNRNPYTLRDIMVHAEVHYVGEIWATVLWDIRCALVSQYGFSNGNALALRLVTDGMKLTPNSPTFLDGRDAILLADRAMNNGANLNLLWQTFARRGMGVHASVSGDGSTDNTVEDFTMPGSIVASLLPEEHGRLVFYGNPGGPFASTATGITLLNRSNSPAGWLVATEAAWLRPSASEGTVPAFGSSTLVLSVDPSSTQARICGTYSTRVYVTDKGTGIQQTISATLEVVRNYTVSTTAYSWIDPSAHEIRGWMPDDSFTDAFSCTDPNLFFRYYDQPVRSFRLASNGMFSFSSSPSGLNQWENTDLPDSNVPNGMVCVLWDDLYPESPSVVSIGLDGTAPNRRLIFSWTNVPHVEQLDKPYTFQAVCFEQSNDIVMNFKELQPLSATHGAGRTATIGVEHFEGCHGTTYSYNGSRSISNQTSIRFSLPPLVLPAFTRQPVSEVWVYRDTSASLSVETSGDPIPSLQWQISSDNGQTWADIAGATSATYTTAPLSLSQSGVRFRATALNAAGIVPSNTSIIRVGTIPLPWIFGDIGAVSIAGTSNCEPTSFGGYRFTLTGSGNGFWGNADSCHALTQSVNGNVTIVVKVVSQTNTDPWAMAGVTMRESLEPGSPQAGVFLTGSNGAAFFRRSVVNQPSAYTAGRRSAVAPRWLKLERIGAVITASESLDGSAWTRIGVTTWPSMSASLIFGISVSSKNAQTSSTAVFESLQIIPGGPG